MRAILAATSLFVLSLLFALSWTAGDQPAFAQDSSSVYIARPGAGGGPMDWLFGRTQRPTAKVIRVPPARASAYGRSYQPRRRSGPAAGPDVPDPAQAPHPDGLPVPLPDAGFWTPPVVVAPPVLPPPVVEPPKPAVTVAVVGDSLSVFLAQGLQETYADRPSITFIRRHRESSGLVRDDYFDWPRQLRELIATTPRIDAMLIQVGSNDRQQLRDGDKVVEPLTDRWRELYAKRIDDVIMVAKEKKVPLIWVGMPPMRSGRYSSDLLTMNGLYKAQAAAAGIAYIEVWEAFSGEDGSYVVNGPDVDGAIVRLRTADGVHFTRSGARKLAFFSDKELKKIIEAVQGKAQPLTSATAAASAAPPLGALAALPPLPEMTLPPALKSTDALLGVALPDPPLPTSLTPRPVAGAMTSLGAAPVSAGGALLRPVRDGRSGAVVPALVGGKPGRADDFRLPSQ